MTDTIPIPSKLVERAASALEDSVGMVRENYETNWRHGIPSRAAQLEGLRKIVETHECALAELRSALTQQAEPAFDVASIEAIYAAWHGAGVDVAGGNWKRFVSMLPNTPLTPPPSPSAEPAKCLTCSGHGLVGRPYEDGQPCPECNMPAQPSGEVLTEEERFEARRGFGYAPGYYTNRCRACAAEMLADKRAWRCMSCADKMIESATLAKIGAK